MRVLIVLTMLIAAVLGQGMGHGVSKSTWGSSDPRACAAWFAKYLTVAGATEAASNCANGVCECATQGRYQLPGGKGQGPQATSFGIHTVNCTEHPYGEHGLADIEKMIHAEWGDFTSFHPFMDYNVGLWTWELNKFVTEFEKGKQNFVGLKWTSDDDKDYYSVLVNPCGFAVIELIAPHVAADMESKFTKVDQMRMSFKNNNNKPSASDGHLTPIKISRATARLDDIAKWYNSDIGAKHLVTKKGDDGSETAIYMFDQPENGVQLHFVQGRTAEHSLIQSKKEADAAFTPKKWEDYMHSVHKAVWKDETCGFDQWFDNHFAYDSMPRDGYHVSLDAVAKNAKNLGYPYHWWSLPQGNSYQVYAVDPTGFSVQFDGQATNPPSDCPSYSAACKSNDGCSGQGICNAKDAMKFFLQ